MSVIDDLAERRILESIAAGELDDLPGKGRPLALDDDSMVPAHLRAGYRLLRNAGYVPPDMDWSRQLREVEDLIDCVGNEGDGASEEGLAGKRLSLLQSRLREAGGARRPLWVLEQDYRERLLRRLGERDRRSER